MFALPKCPESPLKINIENINPIPNWNDCIGVYETNTGIRYEGEFKNGLENGKGIIFFPNGNSYSGEFVNSKRNGKGTYLYANLGKYIGQFKNNKRHGQGTFIWFQNNDVNIVTKLLNKLFSRYSYYEGAWENGKKNGFGIFTDSINGSKQQGIWKNDKIISGVVLFKNGDSCTINVNCDTLK